MHEWPFASPLGAPGDLNVDDAETPFDEQRPDPQASRVSFLGLALGHPDWQVQLEDRITDGVSEPHRPLPRCLATC